MFVDNFNITHVYGKTLLQEMSIDDITIIDIREPFEFRICKVPGSLHIPMNTLLIEHKKLLKKDMTYYIICHTGQRSYYTCDILTNEGYNVVNIVGGIASIDKYNVPY